MNDRAGHHAGAAGEGFIFNAALVGADGDVVWCMGRSKIRVGSLWRKRFVIADRGTVLNDVGAGEVIDEGNDVGHAGVEEMECRVEPGDFGSSIELEVDGVRHGDADVVLNDVCRKGSGDRFEAHAVGWFF